MESFENFVTLHGSQLEQSVVPKHFWSSLHRKLCGEIFDAGNFFTMYQTDEGWCVQVSCEGGMFAHEPENIFLVDHAWTFGSPQQAREHLTTVPGLLDRMESLVEVDQADEDEVGDDGDTGNEKRVENVMHRLWLFTRMYRLTGLAEEDRRPIWYVLDEFGSRLEHSDEPTFGMAPFLYGPTNMAFSLLWPLTDLEFGDEATCDYANGVKEPLLRAARLSPWFPERMAVLLATSPDCLALKEDYKPEERCGETLPRGLSLRPPSNRPIKVYTDLHLLESFLTRPEFAFTESEGEADILWLTEHFKDFAGLVQRPRFVYISQFPCENVLTCKDLLVNTARRARTSSSESSARHVSTEAPDWLPESYNMVTELPQLVARFQMKAAAGEDNFWICKPWNLGRSLDIHITDNLAHLVLLANSGPKVASRYLSRPVLFHRAGVGPVKFDYRYVVLLKSVQPLELFAYKVFWLRFANSRFELARFEDYETHFTVMNYHKDGAVLHQVHCEDFVPLFDEQYPEIGWAKVERDTFQAIKELFVAAASADPPAGIGHCVHSRALYALDIMVEWDGQAENCMRPKILEVNFSPDCVRACKYHPQFFNHVFQAFFLDSLVDCPVERIC